MGNVIAELVGWVFLFILAAVVACAVVGLCAVLIAVVAGLLGYTVPWSHDRLRTVRPRIPARLRRAVLRRDGYRCQQCGSQVDLEMDHVIALSRGGATTLENLEVLCHTCNQSKGANP